jgi:hypothetical protein
VFTVVAIILSVWLGLLFLNTPVILIASFVISYFLIKKFPIKIERVPREVLLLAVIIAILCAHPLLLLHPFYPASNDAFHTIMVRVLQMNEKIPQTFEPYSGISFTYNFGFHLFVKLFADLFFFIPDYLVLWFFGVFFASVQAILIYFFAKELFVSEKAGLYSALLFVGTKMVYQEMFFGIWPRLLATNLFFLYFIFFLRKNKLCLLFPPALACVHAGIFFNVAVFSFLYILFNRAKLTPMLKTLPALVLALPSFVIVYSVSLMGLFAQSKFAEITLALLIKELVSVALWLGWVPLVVAGAGFFWMLYKRNYSKQKLFALAVLVVFVLLYFYLFLKQYPSSNVPMEFAGLGAVLFAGLTLSEIRFKSKEFEKWVKVLIIILCLLAFFASGYLTKFRFGSKISAEQAEFAFRFKEYDPALKEALFLTTGSSKIAEFANKIPFDVTRGFFLPAVKHIVWHDAAWQEVLRKKQLREKILQTKYVQCIYDSNVSYVVIDESYFPVKLKQSPVLEHGNIKLYKLG